MIKPIAKTGLLLLLAAWSAGCADKSVTPNNPPSAEMDAIDTYPAWMQNPDAQGCIGAVGYARAQDNHYMQRQTALIVARARLSERMNAVMESVSVSSISVVNGETDESFHSRATQTARNRIKNAVVRDEYTDEDGVLYLWLTAEKGAL